MQWWTWAVVGLAAAALAYAAFVAALVLAGRGEQARAIARFIPDCAVLFRRLLGDRRVPRSRRLLILGLIGYLASPIDLVPDFIPVAGQLDDAIIVALVLRSVLRSGGPGLVRDHWPGPQESLDFLLRIAYGRAAPELLGIERESDHL